MVVFCGCLLWLYIVCCGYLFRLLIVVVCCGCLMWLFVVVVCCGCLLWYWLEYRFEVLIYIRLSAWTKQQMGSQCWCDTLVIHAEPM